MSILKNKLFIALALAGLLVQGCSKKEIVELTPEFQVDALTNPSSMAQVEQVLLGAYAGFRNANYYGSGSGTGAGWSLMPDVLSDNLYEAVESLANSRDMADWLYTPQTGQIAGIYTAPYQVIASANVVLRDVDKFTTPANRKMANRIKGQALAIRALAHFDLMRYFSVNFDRNSTSVLALPYVKEFTVNTTNRLKRLNNKEYYDNIFADITQALPLLADVDRPVNPASRTTRPFIDQTAVYALQARVNLYAGDWQGAVTAATQAINRVPLVTSQAVFSGMYTEANPGETIWNVQFESGQSGPTFLVYFATVQRSYFRPAPEVATTDGASGLIRSNDIRYNAYFTPIGGRLAMTKYRGKGAASVSDGNANFPVFRTGEMYLIRAEAYARMGGANEVLAMNDLNTLRAARIPGYTPEVLVGSALLTAIANERRRELFGEGHRFFDLKRTTRTITRGSACGSALSVAGNCTLLPNAREWALPIPESVINANESMVQNPGY